MTTNIYLGIDMGSSSLKALALDADSGRTVALARAALPHDRRPGGGCEVAEAAIHAALGRVLGAIAGQLGPLAAAVRAIGCTGHGAGLYALDATGRLVGGSAVASTDQRATARALKLARSHGAALFDDVGCGPWPGQPTLIAAELFGHDAVQRGELQRLLFAKDYLGFLLTGEAATDLSDASTAGLVSLASGRWSQQAFDAAGLSDLSPRTLGRIVPSGEVFGRLLPAQAAACGLPAGVPVAMGAIDLLASMTAIRAEARGHAVAVFGTWSVNAAIGPATPAGAPKPPVAAVVNFGPAERRLYMENSPSSMANIAWAAEALGFGSEQAVIDAAMGSPLGAHGVRFLPFVNGGSAPPGASAGFVGLRSHHGRADMARAVVDAVVALHARHLGRLAAHGLLPGALTMLGGGARDARLARLLAGFLGRPVARCGDDETGARGAALYAAISQGLDLDASANAHLLAPCETLAPEAGDIPACADFLAGFDALLDSLAPAFTLTTGTTRMPDSAR
ncbi:carbohydrate kinase [Variovorax paradoxus]|jgi:L-xylulokinase|uniref:FGGY family carbohydrate kinase n=1 Tax=Variovorax paradoxus TaxID=34073 RepID=UPI0006E70FC1|nr:carbohydrate kinase [Variovorax paradoxus]KPV07363.1 carbohydrate kinase [Variovorax paradoxus]KPV07890.1 carbohydrate kinase [Variovorax paradoxus]KPV21832.1 carbohydrate kinase [Variovorax paradoxus]KPV31669.1 carbohydrate kinase [Variovorax paradoxus]